MISQVFIKCNATSHLNNCENLSIKYCDENPNILTHFIPAFKLPNFDEVKILMIQINFLKFPHASYLVRDVRIADIRTRFAC